MNPSPNPTDPTTSPNPQVEVEGSDTIAPPSPDSDPQVEDDHVPTVRNLSLHDQVAPVLNRAFSEAASPAEDVTWDIGYALLPTGPGEVQAYGMLNVAMRSKMIGSDESVNLTALMDLRGLRDEGQVMQLALHQMHELRQQASKQLEQAMRQAQAAEMPTDDPRSIPEFDMSKITKHG